MADIVDRETRSRLMAGIKGSNTKPELTVRRFLHSRGFRYRLDSKLPGRPDIVLPKHGVAVFVHGCFWHRHPGCKFAYVPKSNLPFWMEKFDANVARDKRAARTLRRLGWRVMTIWACSLDSKRLEALERKILSS